MSVSWLHFYFNLHVCNWMYLYKVEVTWSKLNAEQKTHAIRAEVLCREFKRQEKESRNVQSDAQSDGLATPEFQEPSLIGPIPE